MGAVLGAPQHRAQATAKPPQQRAMARMGKITKTNTTPTAMPAMAPVESDEVEAEVPPHEADAPEAEAEVVQSPEEAGQLKDEETMVVEHSDNDFPRYE